MTEHELVELCQQWQKVLRLQDWDVRARLVRWHEMREPCRNAGECEWSLSKKQAILRIVCPEDAGPNDHWPHDVERTLVHELLHLHLAPLDRDDMDPLEHTAMEQAIHAIACALVELKRASNREAVRA